MLSNLIFVLSVSCTTILGHFQSNLEKYGVDSLNTTNVSFYHDNWALELLDAESAWDLTIGSDSVKVGIIDSGIDNQNQNFNGIINETLSYDVFGHPERDPFFDKYGHGTAVASVVCTNGYSVDGICKNIELVSLRLDYDVLTPIQDQVVSAITYAQTHNIFILNLSYGWDDFYEPLYSAIQSFPGLIIVSAGNDSRNLNGTVKKYPACFDLDNIICVGAIDEQCAVASFSNYGSTDVDIFAPGVNIPIARSRFYEAQINFGFVGDGTSFAAPYVAGTCALLKSLYPSITFKEIKKTILLNAISSTGLNGLCVSNGYLNVYNCLANPHFHTYSSSYLWEDYDTHKAICSCGATAYRGHTVLPGAFSHGETYVRCIYCRGQARRGFSFISGFDDENVLEEYCGEALEL